MTRVENDTAVAYTFQDIALDGARREVFLQPDAKGTLIARTSGAAGAVGQRLIGRAVVVQR